MLNYSFSHSTKFMIKDTEYIVRKEMESEVELENLAYKKIETWSINDLLKMWEQDDLVFKVSEDEGYQIDIQDFEVIPEELRIEALKRYGVLKPVINGDVLTSEIKSYVRALKDGPSLATFYNWKKEWDKSPDIRSLVPRLYKRGPKKRWSNEISLNIAEEVINELSYEGEYHTDDALYSEYLLRIDEFNKIREANLQINPVSRSTFYRKKKDILDIYKKDTEKYGKTQADLNLYGSTTEVIATRPLQRVEIDWTPVDVMLVDPRTLKARRPWLVYAIDKASGHPLGFYVSFDDINAAALKQCLLHCLMPKTYIKELYPLVENDWVAFGKPSEVVLDNSSVNDSKDFEEACFQLRIEHQYCKVGAGNQKGSIERAFRTLNSKYIHGLKGTTYSNILERGVYDSEGKACISMQGFIYICHIALVDMVANSFNKRIGSKPKDKWLKGLAANPQIKTSIGRTKMELKLILMSGLEHRIIQNKGVVIKNEYYTSPELMKLRRQLTTDGKESQAVRVRFDLDDMRSVFVYDEYNRKYIEAKSTGLFRKGIPADYPVHYSELELYSTIINREEDKEDKKQLGRAKRAIAQVQEVEKKKTSKLKKESEQISGSLEQLPTSSYNGISTEGISHIQLETVDAADTIQIIKKDLEEHNTGKRKRNGKKKQHKENVESKIEVNESFDIDLDELPDWEVTFKGD